VNLGNGGKRTRKRVRQFLQCVNHRGCESARDRGSECEVQEVEEEEEGKVETKYVN